MDTKQRKNRPKKKEMSEETWANTFDNLKKELENGGKKESKPSSENSEEK